jgi:hypothetical protein
MQVAATRFAKSDLAKYPFLKENTEYVRKLDLKIEDLTNPEFSTILERAQERVEEAILYTIVSRKARNEEIEILSFPAAIMLTIATQNSFIKKRYALAEAKQTFEDLKLEPKERILAIAKNFGWKLTLDTQTRTPYEFTLDFTDYLKNTTHRKKTRSQRTTKIPAQNKRNLGKNKEALARKNRQNGNGRLPNGHHANGLPTVHRSPVQSFLFGKTPITHRQIRPNLILSKHRHALGESH